MLINPKIKEMVESRYEEMKRENKIEDFFDQSKFGNLKLFINQKPKYSLASFEMQNTPEMVEVFLGSDSI